MSDKNLPAESRELLLVDELRSLIQETRTKVARSVNLALVQLYWQIGTQIRTEVLKSKRADYGKQICVTMSHKLVAEFGNGFSRSNLTRMLQFAEYFSDSQIVSTLSRQLSWSHFVTILVLRQKLHESVARSQRLIEHRDATLETDR